MVLSPHKDPLGRALLDYWKGIPTPPLSVRSDLAEDDLYEIDYYFREEQDFPSWEREALDHCRGHVLDVGAGGGCHALSLQQRGLKVTAIDISPGAVEVMKKRGIKDARLVDFFDLENIRFDTLWLMMNGIGIVGTYEGLHSFLQKVPSVLNPGGRVILDSSDLAYLLEDEEIRVEMLNREKPFGEVTFQTTYKDISSEPFPWLYLDFDSLKQIASGYNYHCSLLIQGPHFEYVAALELNGQ